jgi:hypothetical protein
MKEMLMKGYRQSVIVKLLSLMLFTAIFTSASAYAEDESFVPAYQNEGNYQLEDADKYFAYKDGRKYYTSGKENGFRVNENNEESTDETIGILTFVIVPATLIYMNLVGWWE